MTLTEVEDNTVSQYILQASVKERERIQCRRVPIVFILPSGRKYYWSTTKLAPKDFKYRVVSSLSLPWAYLKLNNWKEKRKWGKENFFPILLILPWSGIDHGITQQYKVIINVNETKKDSLYTVYVRKD